MNNGEESKNTAAETARPVRVEIALQGYQNAISIGKDVIRLLGNPTHICLKINEEGNKIVVAPCIEKEVMSFKVPDKLLTNHRCVFRVYSKQFVHSIMEANGMDMGLSYTIPGIYSEKQNAACFDLRGYRLYDLRKQQVIQ